MVSSEGPYYSLLELIGCEGHNIDTMLEWQENIVLKRLDPSGVSGPAQIRSRDTRRLLINRMERDIWKIAVVGVRDSYVGEDWVRNSLVSNEAIEYRHSDDSDSDYSDRSSELISM